MKKIFFGIVALVAMVATSCQQSLDELNVVGGGDATVTFNVGAGSRAYSDGKTATNLQWAVYAVTENGTSQTLSHLTALDGSKTFELSTTVEFQLTTGNKYAVIFWADADNSPYTVTFDTNGAKMTVDYSNAVSNDENRDAFYKYHEFTVSGSQTESVELKRPFAQLNIGTNDYAASTNAGYAVSHVKVEVPAYSTLNLVSGEAKNVTTAFVFDYAAIPTTETFPVSGHQYMAMNYVLMNSAKETFDVTFTYATDENGANAKSRTVGSVPFQRNHRTNLYGQLLTSNVAVNVEIKPEYDDPMYEADPLQLAAAFGGEVTLTEDVVLDQQLVINEGVNMTINLNGKTISGAVDPNNSERHIYPINNFGNLTINGGTIEGRGIYNRDGATLTINEATVNALDWNGGACVWSYGTGKVYLNNATMTGNTGVVSSEGYVEINGGTYICKGGIKDNGDYSATSPTYCIRAYNGLKITGGTFTSRHGVIAIGGGNAVIDEGSYTIECTAAITSNVLYIYGNTVATINGGKFIMDDTANIGDSGAAVLVTGTEPKVTINEGTFVGLNGMVSGNANTRLYGGNYSTVFGYNHYGNLEPYVATGYKILQKNDVNYVVADTVGAVVSDATELSAAIANGENVVLTGDVTYGSAISNDATIELNGNAFEATGTINLGNNADLTMTSGDYVVNGTYGHVDVRPSTAEGSEVYYEDVNFAFNKLSKTFGPSTNRLGSVVEVCATAIDAHTKITFKNCTFDNAMVLFEGMSGKTGTFEAVFEGCTFNALTSSAPIEIMNYIKGTLKVVNCTFNLECTSSTASAISVSSSTSTVVTVTAENNTLNAVAATPYTYDPSKGETEEYTVKVNGTPKDIKLISTYGGPSTIIENGTVKSGIAL